MSEKTTLPTVPAPSPLTYHEVLSGAAAVVPSAVLIRADVLSALRTVLPDD
jgi:hypothetical protein